MCHSVPLRTDGFPARMPIKVQSASFVPGHQHLDRAAATHAIVSELARVRNVFSLTWISARLSTTRRIGDSSLAVLLIAFRKSQSQRSSEQIVAAKLGNSTWTPLDFQD